MNLPVPLGAVDTGMQTPFGMSGHFGTVFVFIVIGFVFAAIALIVAKILRPSNPSAAKMTTYECGEMPRGSSWIRFNVRFYLIALFFIVFDVEVIFLYPWAVVFRDLFPVAGGLGFGEMLLFIAILVVGLAYVWVKGDLDWVKGLIRRNGTEVSGE